MLTPEPVSSNAHDGGHDEWQVVVEKQAEQMHDAVQQILPPSVVDRARRMVRPNAKYDLSRDAEQVGNGGAAAGLANIALEPVDQDVPLYQVRTEEEEGGLISLQLTCPGDF